MGARDRLKKLRSKVPKRPEELHDRIAVAVDKVCRANKVRPLKVSAFRIKSSVPWNRVFQVDIHGPLYVNEQRVIQEHAVAVSFVDRWPGEPAIGTFEPVRYERYKQQIMERLPEAITRDFCSRFTKYRVKDYLFEFEADVLDGTALCGWDIKGTEIRRHHGDLTEAFMTSMESQFRAEYEAWEFDGKIEDALVGFLGAD
jgi:hypothetical protein